MKTKLFLLSLFCSYSVYSQVGINTTSPTAILHVFGTTTLPSGPFTFRLQDGTQGVNKVLTSDANGNGYWKTSTGGSSYTFSNGLTETSGAVKLGGTLIQNTALDFDTRSFTFRSNKTVNFPGELIIEGTDRNMMMTNFKNNFISFGTSAFLSTTLDGTSFTDSGSTSHTVDVALGVYTGNMGGSGFKMGSIEYIIDGTAEFFVTHDFSPLTDNSNSSGTNTHRWRSIYSTNGTIQTSDLRLKKNIKKLNYGLDEIMKLETITYNWKENKIGKTQVPENQQERKIGFSAQQLLEILPETVSTHSWVAADEEGNYKRIENKNLGVFYSDIIPVAVKAIQEQQVQIEELKKAVEELEKQNELLLKLVNKK